MGDFHIYLKLLWKKGLLRFGGLSLYDTCYLLIILKYSKFAN